MSTAENYFKAAHPSPPRCIGLQLRPYSLGHHVTLYASNSPFLTSPSSVPIRDAFHSLVMGVFVCSQPWRELNDWLTSWKLPLFLKLWGFAYRKFDMRAESERFQEYIARGELKPELQSPDNGVPLVSRWESRLKMFMVRELRLTIDEAMDYPLSLAWEEYCAHGETAGTITLMSDAHRQSLDFINSDECREMMRKAEEEARAEMQAGKN